MPGCSAANTLKIAGSRNMNKINKDKRVQIISALVEGDLLRATARMCNAKPRHPI